MKIRIFGLVDDSIVDGPGLRYALFTQGCPHNCPGCHNPKSHDYNGGYLEECDIILRSIEANSLLDGVTFSGGEPFEQIKPLVYLAKRIKEMGLNIVVYSGYTYEQLLNKEGALELLSLCDMLVDGRFEIEKKSLGLMYRGSSNQRLIDIKKSLQDDVITLYQPNEYNEIII